MSWNDAADAHADRRVRCRRIDSQLFPRDRTFGAPVSRRLTDRHVPLRVPALIALTIIAHTPSSIDDELKGRGRIPIDVESDDKVIEMAVRLISCRALGQGSVSSTRHLRTVSEKVEILVIAGPADFRECR